MHDDTGSGLDHEPPIDPQISPAIAAMMRAAREMLRHEHSLLGSLGLKPLLLGAGRTAFELDLPDRFAGPSGGVHGGFMATILDTIMGLTVFTVLEKARPIATISLRTDYRKAPAPGTRARCEAVCEGLDDDVAHVAARLVAAADGAPLALATGAFIVGARGPSKGSRL